MVVKQSACAAVAEFFLMTVLTCAACLVPLASLVCAVILPVFFAMVTVYRPLKYSAAYAVLQAVVVLALYFIKDGISPSCAADAVLYALSLSLCGIAIGVFIQHTKSIYQIVAAGAGANIIVIVLQIGKLKWLDNIDFTETFINQPIQAFIQFYQAQTASLGEPYTAIADMLSKNVWLFQQAIGAIIPACLLIFSLYLAFFVFLLSRKLLFCWRRIVFADIAHFWEIQCGRYAAIAFAAAFVLSNGLGMSQAGNAVHNLMLVLGAAVMLCGFSVIDYYFRQTGLLCGLRAVIYVFGFFVFNIITILSPLFHTITILVAVGLLDSIFDFRKLRRKEDDAA